ncbi:MAG: hypothetical protein C0483_18730 [Pirellula sp.]|nr:hypothetical protein [Pirellula sp.]
MSLNAIFGRVAARLGRTTWGSKISGIDTGVNPLAQEIAAMLTSNEPIEVRGPISFIKKHTGPLFRVVYGRDDESPLARFYRNNEEFGQVVPTADGENTAGESRVTQTITNSIGSLYRVSSVGDGGIVTLDEIDASGNPTGTQVQARSIT